MFYHYPLPIIICKCDHYVITLCLFREKLLLGKLYTLSSKFKPKTKKRTHNEVLDWIASVHSEYNAPDYAVSELASIKKKLHELPATHDNYGLVHYDFELDNVFYDEENMTCAVIDFDDGMYHWYAMDIEKVFNSLEDELRHETLRVFLIKGELPLNNNATEGALRSFCLYKHTWKLIDTIDDVKSSTIIYSILICLLLFLMQSSVNFFFFPEMYQNFLSFIILLFCFG